MASATAALVVGTGMMLLLAEDEPPDPAAFPAGLPQTTPAPFPRIRLFRRAVRTLIGSSLGGMMNCLCL